MANVGVDDLYPPLSGRWEDGLTEDERAWWDQVVAIFLDDGRRPSPKGIADSYRKNFPDGENEPPETTLRRAIVREAKKAGVELRERR